MILNDSNYYSLEADREYMSVSQYKSFKKCEVSAVAKLQGKYEGLKSEALLLGSYLHEWAEKRNTDQFKKEHPEMFSSVGKTKGQLKSNYKIADNMINALKNDSICMNFLNGEKEVIVTGELFGVKWKAKVDCLNLEKGFFSDLKTTRELHKRYDGLTFIEYYGYVEQMAVYRELIKQQFGKDLIPYIVAVEKKDNPLKAIIRIDECYTRPKLEEIEYTLDRIVKVRNGLETPIGCGMCDYCRSINKVSRILTIDDL
jgi:hypothetical protein